MSKIESLYRYPVKGLSAQKLQQIVVKSGEGFAFDRFWALENGAHDFDSEKPKFFPKRRFLQLAQNPKLAQLTCQFTQDGQNLVITHNSIELVSGDMSEPNDVKAIEQCIAKYMADADHSPRLVSAIGHHFSDIPQKAVSLINLASVNEIAKAAGKDISPLRFRGNIYMTGLEPWVEMDWEGKTIAVDGKPLFDVFAITGRCPATKVNLTTGKRDIEMLDVLSDNFGHTKCGVYARIKNNGQIKPGSKLEIY